MNWGCKVDKAIIKRGKFSLEIDNLEIPDIVFSHENGHKIPLMGVSGAGKSTLLNLLSGMEWPVGGKVSWTFPDNKEISWGKSGLSASKSKQLRRKYFGFAFQNSSLLPHLNVLDNLSYPLQLQKESATNISKKVLKVLTSVLLEDEDEKPEDILKRFPSQLCGGQRQRVAMAQAFIHDPYVLFADEPTGSLDEVTRKQVMDRLVDWVKHGKGERLLLWVTHHKDDPQENKVNIRLCINTKIKGSNKLSKHQWQKLNSHGWEDMDKTT